MTDKKCKRSKECWCSKPLEERIEHFRPLMDEIKNVKAIKRVKLIKKAPSCFVRFLAECGLNVLKGNLKLTDTQYLKLKPHKQTLLSLSKPALSVNDRRGILLKKKKGGFLPVLVPVIASALSAFAGEAVAKAFGL